MILAELIAELIGCLFLLAHLFADGIFWGKEVI